jgi:CDP-diacylglycerol--glycerol-3-phosphate 3-phosphatidyltransferase
VSPPASKPLVTANQVTFARLALLPFGTFMMYQGIRGQWIALCFMTLVGCTDFVDGWLARRYGPTVLGGLMDPIADKVFLAVTFLPMIELEWLPWHIVGLLFLREFVVTAARTSYERRQVPLKTTYLAKVKTWYQMCGGGMIFLFRTVERPWVMHTIGVCLAAAALVSGAIYLVVKRKWWRGSVVFTFSFGALAALEIFGGPKVASVVLGWAIVAITWFSGAAYFFGIKQLRAKAGIDLADVIRLYGAIALPVLAAVAIAQDVAPAWPIFTAVALEFGIGGLDNLLANSGRTPSTGGWAARVVPQTLLLGAAVLLTLRHQTELAYALYIAALGVTAASAGIVFWRNRAVYLAPPKAAEASKGLPGWLG